MKQTRNGLKQRAINANHISGCKELQEKCFSIYLAPSMHFHDGTSHTVDENQAWTIHYLYDSLTTHPLEPNNHSYICNTLPHMMFRISLVSAILFITTTFVGGLNHPCIHIHDIAAAASRATIHQITVDAQDTMNLLLLDQSSKEYEVGMLDAQKRLLKTINTDDLSRNSAKSLFQSQMSILLVLVGLYKYLQVVMDAANVLVCDGILHILLNLVSTEAGQLLVAAVLLSVNFGAIAIVFGLLKWNITRSTTVCNKEWEANVILRMQRLLDVHYIMVAHYRLLNGGNDDEESMKSFFGM